MKFMGAETFYRHEDYRTDFVFDKSELHFHESWDWLMPVVQRCKDSQIFGSQKLIDDMDDALTIGFEIHHVYNEVIRFIEFHNENKEG